MPSKRPPKLPMAPRAVRPGSFSGGGGGGAVSKHGRPLAAKVKGAANVAARRQFRGRRWRKGEAEHAHPSYKSALSIYICTIVILIILIFNIYTYYILCISHVCSYTLYKFNSTH